VSGFPTTRIVSLSDDEIEEALDCEPKAFDRGLLSTHAHRELERLTLDEDEDDHTALLAPDLGGES
jgi:hypothetical protein